MVFQHINYFAHHLLCRANMSQNHTKDLLDPKSNNKEYFNDDDMISAQSLQSVLKDHSARQQHMVRTHYVSSLTCP
jgi:hypothetical protein